MYICKHLKLNTLYIHANLRNLKQYYIYNTIYIYIYTIYICELTAYIANINNDVHGLKYTFFSYKY